jgi:hypothetical protein
MSSSRRKPPWNVSEPALRRGLVATVVALAAMAGTASAHGVQSPSAYPAHGPGIEAHAASGASCVVTGYTLHAMQEMAADGIGSDYVEDVVHSKCSSARKQSNGRYFYTDGKIVVIAEPDGYVVTVYRRS